MKTEQELLVEYKEKIVKLPYDNLVIEPRDKSFLKKLKVVDHIQIKVKHFINDSSAHYCKWVKNGSTESLERKSISIKDISEWEVVERFKSYSEYERLNNEYQKESTDDNDRYLHTNLYDIWNKTKTEKKKSDKNIPKKNKKK